MGTKAGVPGQESQPKRLAGKEGMWAMLIDVYTLTTHPNRANIHIKADIMQH
jgi:hypothetical protein